MNHDAGIGQGITFSRRTRSQEEGSHAGSRTEADSGYVRLDMLHGVVNSQPGGDYAARTINIQMNVFVRIFRFQKQKLGDDHIGNIVVNGPADKYYAVLKQTGIDIVGPLAPVGLLYYHWYI